MQRRSRHFVRAFLPLIPLCFCHGCGGGGGDAATARASAARTVRRARAGRPSMRRRPSRSPAIEDAQVGATFDYQPVAPDPDGDALQFSAVNLPTWASLDPTSGRISGTPGANDVGVYESITITVADATHQVVDRAVFDHRDPGAGIRQPASPHCNGKCRRRK